LKRLYAPSRIPLHVVYNAVDTQRFKPNLQERDDRHLSELGVDIVFNYFVMILLFYCILVNVVVVQRMSYRKGPDLLAECMLRVCSTNSLVRFLVGMSLFVFVCSSLIDSGRWT
jgi:glycosyltransferase involved in cell wall biosynthesis